MIHPPATTPEPPNFLRRLFQAALLSLAAFPVLGALAVGALWLRTSLPHPATIDSATATPVNVAPREATIPWLRDPDHLPPVAVTPGWFPWQKMPKGARPTPSGGPPPAGASRIHLDPAEATTVTDGLASADPARHQAAILQMTALLDRDPLSVAEYLRTPFAAWARPLLDHKDFATLDALTDRLMIGCAHDTRALETLASLRVKTALAQGDASAALERCREWFAISTLHGTAPVLTAIEETLTFQHATRAQIRNFRNAMMTPASPTTAPATQSAISLQIDPHSPEAQHFLTAARRIFGEDFPALVARGNLYLLAGRPDLARLVFRRASMLATDAQFPAATENLARCVKAETTSIPAANAFLQEHH